MFEGLCLKEQVSGSGGATPGEGDAGAAVAVVVDDEAVAAALAVDADGRPGRAQADGDGQRDEAGEGRLEASATIEDRPGAGRVRHGVVDALVGGAAEHDVVAARDDVGDPGAAVLIDPDARKPGVVDPQQLA